MNKPLQFVQQAALLAGTLSISLFSITPAIAQTEQSPSSQEEMPSAPSESSSEDRLDETPTDPSGQENTRTTDRVEELNEGSSDATSGNESEPSMGSSDSSEEMTTPAEPSSQGTTQTPGQTTETPAEPSSQGTTQTPDTPSSTSEQPTSGSLVAIAASNQEFQTLAQAIEAAGLENTLAQAGPYTIFAPTNEAFNELPDGALELLLKPENQSLLRQVLTYHVVPGEVTSDELSTGSVSTLNGGIAVRVEPDRVIINDGSVVQADIQASNGVIHAVNRVLIPSELRSQLEAQLQNQQ